MRQAARPGTAPAAAARRAPDPLQEPRAKGPWPPRTRDWTGLVA